MATSEVRIKLNHLMGWGLALPSLRPSCHLLNSITFKTINTMAAEKNNTWKNFIMVSRFYSREVKVFDENVSSNYKVPLAQGRRPLSEWRMVQIHGTRAA
jgi:hypothetical protein